MQKQDAKETLISFEQYLREKIEELSEIKDDPKNQFAYGEKVAYTECYEMLCIWKDAIRYGWKEDIEKKFPL